MSLLYRFVRWYSRQVLPIFFGKLQIIGKENLPKEAPYILAPNHQNSFLDAVIIGAMNDKPVSFLARSDVFVPPYDTILAALNMIPVYRMRDGYNKLSLNNATFDKCEKILARGHPVLIFPESNTAHDFHLRPITKGIARLAFQSFSHLQTALYIIPVGLNYGHHRYPRHRLILKYGPPIDISQYHDLYSQHEAKGLIALKKAIVQGMKSTLLIPDQDQDYLDKIKIYNRQYEHLDFEELQQRLQHPDLLVDEPYYPLLKWPILLVSILNFVPLMVLRRLLSGLRDPQFILSYKFMALLFIFPLWWLVLGLMTGIAYNWTLAFIVVSSAIIMLLLRAVLIKRLR